MSTHLDRQVALILAIIKNQLFNCPIDIEASMPDDLNWHVFFTTASKQGVLPIVVQYLSESKHCQSIDENLFSKWKTTAILQVLYSENLNAHQNALILILNKEQIPYAILKGSSVSFCYPKPELRPLGDIDFLVSPDDLQRTVDVLLENGYSRRELELYVHEVLDKDGVTVEPHYAISDIPDNTAGQNIKALLVNALHCTETVELDKNTFSVLSPEHQAIALLLHMEKHITKRGIDLRRIIDWAVFIEKRTSSSIWEMEIQPVLVKCGLSQFANAITKVCVMFFGLHRERCLWAYAESIKNDDALTHSLMELILKSCDLDYKQMNLAIQFSVEKKKSDEGRSIAQTIFSNITTITLRDFPISKKVPILFPFVWVYSAVHNIIRYKFDAGVKTSIFKSLKEARQTKALFEELRIFQPESSNV